MGAPASKRSDDELWQGLASHWERRRRLLWEPTRRVSEWLIERLDPEPGQTILELAAGTGETGLLAAARLGAEGRLISSDRSPKMVEAARRLAGELGVTNAEFRVIDSEHVELGDQSVDGVLCRFGYLLRGDPPAALHETRRVLRFGGRVAFSVWGERSRNPWISVPRSVLVERGHLPEPLADGSDPLEQRTVERVAQLLDEASFSEPQIEGMPIAYRFADGEELWAFLSELRGEIALTIAKLDEAERRVVRAEIAARADRTADGGYVLAGYSLNVLAV